MTLLRRLTCRLIFKRSPRHIVDAAAFLVFFSGASIFDSNASFVKAQVSLTSSRTYHNRGFVVLLAHQELVVISALCVISSAPYRVLGLKLDAVAFHRVELGQIEFYVIADIFIRGTFRNINFSSLYTYLSLEILVLRRVGCIIDEVKLRHIQLARFTCTAVGVARTGSHEKV